MTKRVSQLITALTTAVDDATLDAVEAALEELRATKYQEALRFRIAEVGVDAYDAAGHREAVAAHAAVCDAIAVIYQLRRTSK